VNWKGRTALHCAAFANRPLTVFLLLLHGAKRDVLNKERLTAKDEADNKGSEECLKLLETKLGACVVVLFFDEIVLVLPPRRDRCIALSQP
jgi:ankyrin repeat protein